MRIRCAAGLLMLPHDAGVQSVKQPLHASAPDERAAERRRHGARLELPAVQQQWRCAAGARDHRVRPALLRCAREQVHAVQHGRHVATSARVLKHGGRMQELPAGSTTWHCQAPIMAFSVPTSATTCSIDAGEQPYARPRSHASKARECGTERTVDCHSQASSVGPQGSSTCPATSRRTTPSR